MHPIQENTRYSLYIIYLKPTFQNCSNLSFVIEDIEEGHTYISSFTYLIFNTQ